MFLLNVIVFVPVNLKQQFIHIVLTYLWHSSVTYGMPRCNVALVTDIKPHAKRQEIAFYITLKTITLTKVT